MASIRQRSSGSYQITVSCGRDIHGRKLTETATFRPDDSLTPKKREKAVAEFAHDFEQKVLGGLAMDGRKITLKEFSDRWLSEYACQRLQGRTLEGYRQELNDRILPRLGHLKLSELRPAAINAFLVSLSGDGARKDGKPGGLARATIVKTEAVLSSVLQTATEWELLDRNPCANVRIRAEDAAQRIKYFSPEQAAEFLRFLEQPYPVTVKSHRRVDDAGRACRVDGYTSQRSVPEQLRVLFSLALFSGLRKGELLALQWSDIDLDGCQIQVSKAATLAEGVQTVKCPKTRTSNRTVSIPGFLADRLRRLKAEQLRTRLGLGDYWKGEDWVFTQDDGKMMHYGTPAHAFRDILLRYNADRPEAEQLPLIPFHGLRHTSATLLIAAHQDIKTVQNRLGHAEASTTMNIYAHALQESDRKAADALENLLTRQA